MKLKLLIIATLISHFSYAQTDSISREEKKLYSFSRYIRTNHGGENWVATFDSMNGIFYKNFMQVLLMPGADQYEFKLLKKSGVNIIASPDTRVRAFCWDLQTTGTMGLWQALVQYKDDKGGLHIYEIGDGNQIDSICTVVPGVYLFFELGKAWALCHGYFIHNFQIHGDKASMEKKIFDRDTCFASDIRLGFLVDPRVENIKIRYDSERKEIRYTDMDKTKTVMVYDGSVFRKRKR